MAILAGDKTHNSTTPQSMFVINNTVITVQDTKFFEGFQHGFQHGFQERAVPTDQDLYRLCLQVIDVQKSGIYQSGVIVGAIAAMLDIQSDCKLFAIPPKDNTETLEQDH